jgi:hypothetical protein
LLSAVALFLSAGCVDNAKIARDELLSILPKLCRSKYQTRVLCREVENTLWVYLPYTPGRSGRAGTRQDNDKLYVEYTIASVNPFKVLEPPELRFLVQRVLGEIRQLLLRSKKPYKFFVLVVVDISSKLSPVDEWYMGYFPDVLRFKVGKDFSGEGYSRLVWHAEPIGSKNDPVEGSVPESYRDLEGKHVNFHEMTMREFIEKMIKWRIYKKFTIEYNKNPFDLSAQEKQDAVILIIKKVLVAYKFQEFQEFYLKDSSFTDEHKAFIGFRQEEIEKLGTREITRGPAF